MKFALFNLIISIIFFIINTHNALSSLNNNNNLNSDIDIYILPSNKYIMKNQDRNNIKNDIERQIMNRLFSMQNKIKRVNNIQFINNNAIMPLIQKEIDNKKLYIEAQRNLDPYYTNEHIKEKKTNRIHNENNNNRNKGMHINISEEMIIDLLSMKYALEKEVKQYKLNNHINNRKKAIINEISLSPTKTNDNKRYIINKATNEIATIQMNPSLTPHYNNSEEEPEIYDILLNQTLTSNNNNTSIHS
jgi:hypothetical protein